MRVLKNENGNIVGIQEVQIPTSSQNIKAEIDGLKSLIQQYSEKIVELESTLIEVEILENNN